MFSWLLICSAILFSNTEPEKNNILKNWTRKKKKNTKKEPEKKKKKKKNEGHSWSIVTTVVNIGVNATCEHFKPDIYWKKQLN